MDYKAIYQQALNKRSLRQIEQSLTIRSRIDKFKQQTERLENKKTKAFVQNILTKLN